MSIRVKVKDTYQVTYTIIVPENGSTENDKDVEDRAWDIMQTTYIKPTITKIKGSLTQAVLAQYITDSAQPTGPAYFNNLPGDEFIDLIHEGCIDPDQAFGNYTTLIELMQFLTNHPKFCVGGLFYKNDRIIPTTITCNVVLDNEEIIEYLMFARKADELCSVNGNLSAWWD